MMVEQLHELRPGGLGAAVRAKTLHDGRNTLGVGVGQKASEDVRDVGLPLPEFRSSQWRVVIGDHHHVLRSAGRRRLLSRQTHITDVP